MKYLDLLKFKLCKQDREKAYFFFLLSIFWVMIWGPKNLPWQSMSFSFLSIIKNLQIFLYLFQSIAVNILLDAQFFLSTVCFLQDTSSLWYHSYFLAQDTVSLFCPCPSPDLKSTIFPRRTDSFSLKLFISSNFCLSVVALSFTTVVSLPSCFSF